MNTDVLYLENLSKNSKEINLIPKMNYDKKSFLKNIYSITNWSTLHDFYNRNKFIEKITINRILNYSWEIFIKDYKLELNKIYKIYEIYFNKKNIEIKSILRRIPQKNIHEFITSHL